MSAVITVVLFLIQASLLFTAFNAFMAMLDGNGASPAEAVADSFVSQYRIILEGFKIIGTSLFVLVFLPFKLVEITREQTA